MRKKSRMGISGSSVTGFCGLVSMAGATAGNRIARKAIGRNIVVVRPRIHDGRSRLESGRTKLKSSTLRTVKMIQVSLLLFPRNQPAQLHPDLRLKIGPTPKISFRRFRERGIHASKETCQMAPAIFRVVSSNWPFGRLLQNLLYPIIEIGRCSQSLV